MRLKTLLLGSATALAVVGGAQAADLSVAEPVDYVKVCDAFGVGYWYIPGTDTCIKIWGFAEFKAIFDSRASEDLDVHYDFYTGMYLNFSAKSMTDWGPLEAFLAFYANRAGTFMDEAYLSLGPLLAGYTHSGFNQPYPQVLDDSSDAGWFQPEEKTDLVRLTYAVNGLGFLLELDEPDYTQHFFPGGAPPRSNDYYSFASSIPDVIAALTASTANLDGKVSFVWSDYSGGWAASAGVVVKLDSLSAGSKVLLKAAYGDDAPYYVLGRSGAAFWSFGPAWSAMANLVYYFSPSLYVSIVANYGSWQNFGGSNRSQWQGAFDIGYSPAPNLWITPEIRYWSDIQGLGGNQSHWKVTLRARRVFF